MLNKLIANRQEVAIYYTDGVSTKTVYGLIVDVDKQLGLIKIMYNQRECIFPLTAVVRIEPLLEKHGLER